MLHRSHPTTQETHWEGNETCPKWDNKSLSSVHTKRTHLSFPNFRPTWHLYLTHEHFPNSWYWPGILRERKKNLYDLWEVLRIPKTTWNHSELINRLVNHSTSLTPLLISQHDIRLNNNNRYIFLGLPILFLRATSIYKEILC